MNGNVPSTLRCGCCCRRIQVVGREFHSIRRRDVGRRFRRRHSGNGETRRSSILQGRGGSKSRSPKLAMLLAVRQMLPHTVPRLLYLAVGARRVVDALGITGCAAEAVFEGIDRGGGGRAQADSKSRRETDYGGPTIRWLRRA